MKRPWHRGKGCASVKISIITPSFNQGSFIESTISSVLAQTGEFELEYIIVDGGSTDNTLEILKRHEGRARIISEPDQGQSDALNKGFHMATGDVLGWLNSDDLYEPRALQKVALAWLEQPFYWCFGDCRIIDAQNREIRRVITQYKKRQAAAFSYARLLRRDFISQPAVFFSKRAFEETGLLDLRLHYAMDYDYWLRLANRRDPLYIPEFLASFRWHPESKNSRRYPLAAREAYEVALRYGLPAHRRDLLLHFAHLQALKILYRFL